jgi:hypothetical protein
MHVSGDHGKDAKLTEEDVMKKKEEVEVVDVN